MSFSTLVSPVEFPAQLLTAIDFAAQKHSSQRRKDKNRTPYIEHPIGVCKLIAAVGRIADLATLQAGVLHDTLEDTDTTYEELVKTFGQEVADIVKECSDDKSKPKEARKREQIEHAKHISKKAKIVKLADKLHNLTSFKTECPVGWNVERVQGYFVWSRAVVANLRGANFWLENALDALFFCGSFTVEGEAYSAIPAGDLDEFLDAYLADMAEAGKTEDPAAPPAPADVDEDDDLEPHLRGLRLVKGPAIEM